MSTLKLWKRRIERAKELELSVPDPCILLGALDAITFNAVKKDPQRLFRLNSARESMGADVTTTDEVVNNMLEAELEESVAASWSTVSPKVKSVKGTPKGDKGKGTKGTKGEKGNGKCEKGKKSSEPRYFFY